MGAHTINWVFGLFNWVCVLFRDVSGHIAQSMPEGIGDQEYSVSTQLKDDNLTE